MRNILDRCERVLTYIGVLSIFLMMRLTTADTVGRYVFSKPITGAYEITEKYLMLVTIFLAMSYAYRGGAFIRVTIVMDRLPRKMKIPINYFSQIFTILYGGILIVATFQHALRLFRQGTTLGSIASFPQWPTGFVIPLGLLLMSLFILLDLPRVRTGKSALFQEDSRST